LPVKIKKTIYSVIHTLYYEIFKRLPQPQTKSNHGNKTAEKSLPVIIREDEVTRGTQLLKPSKDKREGASRKRARAFQLDAEEML
jgi:hypothetical protein